MDLGGAQQDLDDVYEGMFANSTGGEGQFGWVTEIGAFVNEFLVRDEFGPVQTQTEDGAR
ncbi:MAG: hypothetical protein R3C29_17770 [Dehalococcoidia bacterium]